MSEDTGARMGDSDSSEFEVSNCTFEDSDTWEVDGDSLA